MRNREMLKDEHSIKSKKHKLNKARQDESTNQKQEKQRKRDETFKL